MKRRTERCQGHRAVVLGELDKSTERRACRRQAPGTVPARSSSKSSETHVRCFTVSYGNQLPLLAVQEKSMVPCVVRMVPLAGVHCRSSGVEKHDHRALSASASHSCKTPCRAMLSFPHGKEIKTAQPCQGHHIHFATLLNTLQIKNSEAKCCWQGYAVFSPGQRDEDHRALQGPLNHACNPPEHPPTQRNTEPLAGLCCLSSGVEMHDHNPLSASASYSCKIPGRAMLS
jgi:hypothetical protein